MRFIRSKWGWGVGAVLLLVLAFVVAQRAGSRPTAAETTTTSPIHRKPIKKPVQPVKPKPKPKKPRVIIKRAPPVVRTTTVVEAAPARPPVTVTVTRTVTAPAAKPAQPVKPKTTPKPKPAKPKVIAPFVWVIAFVASPGNQPQTVRLREYDGKDIVNVKVLKSGTTYRYRYKHKADQLCQVIKPGTTATSPVCVEIKGKSQVITFTNSQA